MSTVRLLLSRGADSALRGKWGRCTGTAASFARARGSREAAEAIRRFHEGEEDDDGNGT